jgi:hypothetical protein
MLMAHASALATGLFLLLQPGDLPEHAWQSVTDGTTISAVLQVDARLLAREHGEALTVVVTCNVATSSPTLHIRLISDNIGIQPVERLRFSFEPSTRAGTTATLLPVPIMLETDTPQSVSLAPDLVPTVAKRLAGTDRFELYFADALERNRVVPVAVTNGPDLPKLLEPCTF